MTLPGRATTEDRARTADEAADSEDLHLDSSSDTERDTDSGNDEHQNVPDYGPVSEGLIRQLFGEVSDPK